MGILKDPEVGKYAWHVHHQTLYEKLTEPMQKRIDYVKQTKGMGQVPLRLKLMRVVKAQKALDTADAKYKDAWSRYDGALLTASDKYVGATARAKAEKDAEAAYAEAMKPYGDIHALHAKECEPDCPWDGRTIFPV